jgi:hypothetical protein
MTRRSSLVARAALAVSAANPGSPSASMMAHAAASGPAGFEPVIVGFTTGYPGQAVVAKYWYRCRSRPRVSSTETPLGA